MARKTWWGNMKINIGETLARRTRRMPNREALVETDSGRRFTYSELNTRTNKFANGLTQLGVSGICRRF